MTKEKLLQVSNQNVFQSLKNLDPSLMIFDNMDYGSDPNRNPKMQLRGTSSFNLSGGEVDLKGTYGTDPNAPLFILVDFRGNGTKNHGLGYEPGGEFDDLERRISKGYLWFEGGQTGLLLLKPRKRQTGSYECRIPEVLIFLSRICLPII